MCKIKVFNVLLRLKQLENDHITKMPSKIKIIVIGAGNP